jgi:hypothetical protein
MKNDKIFQTQFDPAIIPVNRTILNDYMNKREVVEESSSDDISHDEILDEMINDYDEKKLKKFNDKEKTKIFQAYRQIRQMN